MFFFDAKEHRDLVRDKLEEEHLKVMLAMQKIENSNVKKHIEFSANLLYTELLSKINKVVVNADTANHDLDEIESIVEKTYKNYFK